MANRTVSEVIQETHIVHTEDVGFARAGHEENNNNWMIWPPSVKFTSQSGGLNKQQAICNSSNGPFTTGFAGVVIKRCRGEPCMTDCNRKVSLRSNVFAEFEQFRSKSVATMS